MRITPHRARIYLLLAALFLALPSISKTIFPDHQGELLVAPSTLTEGPFAQSVIYLRRHDLFSASGLIINKPLSTAEKAQMPPALVNKNVFNGGPVQFQKAIVVSGMTGEVRYYTGFAGWAPLQLDIEILRQRWHVIEAERALIQMAPEDMWREAIEKVRTAQGARGDGIL